MQLLQLHKPVRPPCFSESDPQSPSFISKVTEEVYLDIPDANSISKSQKTSPRVDNNFAKPCQPIVTAFPIEEDSPNEVPGQGPIILSFPNLEEAESPCVTQSGEEKVSAVLPSEEKFQESAQITKKQTKVFNQEAFQERIETFQALHKKKIVDRKAKLTETAESECSFHPKINSTYPKRTGKVGDRLYALDNGLRLKKQEKASKLLEEKKEHEIENCTFKPIINNTKVESKLLAEKQVIDPEKYSTSTFHPYTNKIPSKMKAVQEYLQLPSFRRLTGETNITLSSKGNLSGGRSKSKESYNSKKINNQEFFKRQTEFEGKKQRKREKLVEDIKKKTIQDVPKINESSKNMVKSRPTSREHCHHKSNTDSVCTFKPELTQYAKQIGKRTINNLINEPILKKNESVEHIKQKLLEKEINEVTFKPCLCKASKQYSSVGSKLLLKSSTEEYIQTINAKAEEKNKLSAFYREVKALKEIAECPFSPQINNDGSVDIAMSKNS